MTSSLPPLTQALTGALGSAAANSIVYPLDLACARLQTLSPKDRHRHGTGLNGALAILRERARAHGFGALYDGLESDTAATVLSKYVLLTLHHRLVED
jgi:solute carrier family 25 (peroxisomal adenine nucleotide transporter), member 17